LFLLHLLFLTSVANYYNRGKTIWGSDADKAAVTADFASIRGNFTGIPLVLGEFEANMVVEAAGRRKYLDWVARTAKTYATSVMVWDNGEGYLDRVLHKLRDPVAIELVETAIKGVTNSLADSTTDPAAATQFSSAYVYHKVGDAVVDQALPFLLNGNTVKSIATSTGTALTSSDYSVSGSNVTIKSAFLSKYLSSSAAPGSKANLTVTFSAGAHANIEIVQYAVPTLGSSSSAAVAGADLSIPVTWKGLNKVAAVKMLESNQVYLFDTWTVYYGPLQQARGVSSLAW
jgi:endoglucanase